MAINPTVQPGDPGHAAHHRALAVQSNSDHAVITTGRLSEDELSGTYVLVRTSDGHPLAPGTVVVLTLDKTLAEITSVPVADIADITFEEA